MVTDEGGKVFENDYIVREFDGMKVGIFGLANDDTPSQTAPSWKRLILLLSLIHK